LSNGKDQVTGAFRQVDIAVSSPLFYRDLRGNGTGYLAVRGDPDWPSIAKNIRSSRSANAVDLDFDRIAIRRTLGPLGRTLQDMEKYKWVAADVPGLCPSLDELLGLWPEGFPALLRRTKLPREFRRPEMAIPSIARGLAGEPGL